jgi:hypothetical protein
VIFDRKIGEEPIELGITALRLHREVANGLATFATFALHDEPANPSSEHGDLRGQTCDPDIDRLESLIMAAREVDEDLDRLRVAVDPLVEAVQAHIEAVQARAVGSQLFAMCASS